MTVAVDLYIGTILSTVILLFSTIISAATITEVQSVQVSSTIVTTYHVYNLSRQIVNQMQGVGVLN